MRKIEMRMNNALRNQTNFTSGNTAIFTTGNESRVYLHSNLIATIYRDGTKNCLVLYYIYIYL